MMWAFLPKWQSRPPTTLECIEEQKKQIAEQTEELASIYNTIPCAIARLVKKDDGTFSIVSYNSAVSAFTGVRAEDIGKLD